MKLPWDKEYLKISFHVIVTILAIFIIGMVIANMGLVVSNIASFFDAFVVVMGPVLVALVFSYIANPAVEFFQNKTEGLLPAKNSGNGNERYKKRTRGTAITYIILLILLFWGVKLAVNKIGSTDINELANSINDSIQGFSDMLVLLEVKLADIGVLENAEGFITSATNFFKDSILSFANSVSRAGGWAVNLGIGLAAAFYLLAEKERILYYTNDIVDVFFNRKWAGRIKGVAHDFNAVFSGYIGGQITDAFIMAVLISVTFSILGVPYPIIIGVISGFSNLIPYVGAIVAFILSVAVALLSGTPIKALYAAIAVLVLQQIDGMFIVPKVVGKSVELHPVLVLLSLSVFGSMFGILGMIVAVPCTALIKLMLSRLYHRKKEEAENGL